MISAELHDQDINLGTGHDDPCWCDSGRKYKVCHGRRGPLPLSERAAWLHQKAGQFLADGRSYHEAEDLADIRSQHWAHPDAMEHAMLDPETYSMRLVPAGH